MTIDVCVLTYQLLCCHLYHKPVLESDFHVPMLIVVVVVVGDIYPSGPLEG
jgi:hypothetical protein